MSTEHLTIIDEPFEFNRTAMLTVDTAMSGEMARRYTELLDALGEQAEEIAIGFKRFSEAFEAFRAPKIDMVLIQQQLRKVAQLEAASNQFTIGMEISDSSPHHTAYRRRDVKRNVKCLKGRVRYPIDFRVALICPSCHNKGVILAGVTNTAFCMVCFQWERDLL